VKSQENRFCQSTFGEWNRRPEGPTTKAHDDQKWRPDEGYSDGGIVTEQRNRADVGNRNTFRSEGDQTSGSQSCDKFLSREESRRTEQPWHKDTPLHAQAHNQPWHFSQSVSYISRNETIDEARMIITKLPTTKRSRSLGA